MPRAFKYDVLFIWVILVLISGLYHFQNSNELSVISWDVYGYYLYLPSLFKFQDWHQFTFTAQHLQEYEMCSTIYQLIETPEGKKAPLYTIGMAILYVPFYFMADIFASLTGYKNDGMSSPYQWMIVVGSWCYSFLGLWFLSKSLRKIKFKRAVIFCVLLAIGIGTNYFHYVVYENGMPHSFLFSLYAMMMYSTISWHAKPRMREAVFLAVSIALLALARPSEIIALIIPLSFGIISPFSFRLKIQTILKYQKHLIVFTLTGMSMVFLQMMFWKINIDQWLFNGYSAHKFDFASPHLVDGFFSYRKGWLIYTPIMLFSLFGFAPMYQKWRVGFYGILFFFVLNIYIVFSWPIWWYASSFGMRSVIQSYAVLAFPLAFFIQRVFQKKWSKYFFLSLGGVFILLNQFQDWQYRNKILLQDEMTKTFYWKSFLKTDVDRSLRRFVDIDEESPYDGSRFSLINEINYADSAAVDFVGNKVGRAAKSIRRKSPYSDLIKMKITDENITDFKGGWLQATAWVYTKEDKQYDHQTAKFVISTSGSVSKWIGVRFQRYIKLNEWNEVKFEYQIPENIQVGDQIECLIWNEGLDVVYVNSFDLRLIY